MSAAISHRCPHCGLSVPDDLQGTVIGRHYDTEHNPRRAVDVPNLNDVRQRALTEVRRLAATRRPFTMYDVFAVSGDLPNHRFENGKFSAEIERAGIAHVDHYDKSTRPGTRSSAVAVWLGGPKPATERNAAA